MKKIVSTLFVFILFMGSVYADNLTVKSMTGPKAQQTTVQDSSLMSFNEALAQTKTKPMIVLLYAEWAENYQTYLDAFKKIQSTFGDKYNYVQINMAESDTANYNKKYDIYKNLPYAVMFRSSGMVSRWIPNDCAKDYSCFESKAKSFLK